MISMYYISVRMVKFRSNVVIIKLILTQDWWSRFWATSLRFRSLLVWKNCFDLSDNLDAPMPMFFLIIDGYTWSPVYRKLASTCPEKWYRTMTRPRLCCLKSTYATNIFMAKFKHLFWHLLRRIVIPELPLLSRKRIR